MNTQHRSAAGTDFTRTAVARATAAVLAAAALGAVTALSGCSSTDAAAKPGDSTSSPSPTSPTSAALVLTDRGIGGLGLGMGQKEAMATGLVGRLTKISAGEPCQLYHGNNGLEWVYFHAGKVVVIAVDSSIRTDRGIGVGDTYQALHEQYGDAIKGTAPGRLYAEAAGAQIKASYRFGMDSSGNQVYPNDKIIEIALQSNDYQCYE